ncbi:MAG: hypothetical protein LBC48_09890 [Dysgonamonadaceae bacterium]|jgi:hypothetical protein|nr:hypothetical protein [Dysgonamonadaceae bacterium]
MKIITAVRNLKAVHAYSGEPLRNTHIAEIKEFIQKTPPPLGANVRIHWFRGSRDDDKVTGLGTYGKAKDVYEFLAAVYKKAPLAEEAAAYLLEQIILFCTDLGIGTCWLIDRFHHENFLKRIDLKPGEILRLIVPVGYPSNKRRKFGFIKDAVDKPGYHRPFEKVFFNKNFDTPLHEHQAGIYVEPLETVRLGAFGVNRQSCHIVLDNNNLHFFKFPTEFDTVDIGIALCHFEQSCIELGITGQYKFVNTKIKSRKFEYVISWIPEQNNPPLI